MNITIIDIIRSITSTITSIIVIIITINRLLLWSSWRPGDPPRVAD